MEHFFFGTNVAVSLDYIYTKGSVYVVTLLFLCSRLATKLCISELPATGHWMRVHVHETADSEKRSWKWTKI